MSDTPRTDKEASDGWWGDAICVSADFARDLERESAQLAAVLELMTDHLDRVGDSRKDRPYIEAARKVLAKRDASITP